MEAGRRGWYIWAYNCVYMTGGETYSLLIIFYGGGNITEKTYTLLWCRFIGSKPLPSLSAPQHPVVSLRVSSLCLAAGIYGMFTGLA
jgi:hypothetical protein